MKNFLLFIAIIITVAACQSKTEQPPIAVTPLYNNASLSDTARVQYEQPVFAKSRPKRAQVNRTPRVIVHHDITPTYEPPVQISPVVTTPVITPADGGSVPATTGVGSNGSTGTASTIPEPEKKKGWSKAAKGAVIGAGAGAIGGAILSKKKGLGAVIGGVVGAAGGYVIGKGMDKKDNRLITN